MVRFRSRRISVDHRKEQNRWHAEDVRTPSPEERGIGGSFTFMKMILLTEKGGEDGSGSLLLRLRCQSGKSAKLRWSFYGPQIRASLPLDRQSSLRTTWRVS